MNNIDFDILIFSRHPTATVSTDVGNVEVQGDQNCLQVICEAGPAIKQVVLRVDGVKNS